MPARTANERGNAWLTGGVFNGPDCTRHERVNQAAVRPAGTASMSTLSGKTIPYLFFCSRVTFAVDVLHENFCVFSRCTLKSGHWHQMISTHARKLFCLGT